MSESSVAVEWVLFGLCVFGAVTADVQARLILSSLRGIGNSYPVLDPFLKRLQRKVLRPFTYLLFFVYCYLATVSAPWGAALRPLKLFFQSLFLLFLIAVGYWMIIRILWVIRFTSDTLITNYLQDKWAEVYFKEVSFGVTYFCIFITGLGLASAALSIISGQQLSAIIAQMFVTYNVFSIALSLAVVFPLRDIVSGISLLFDRPFEIGDHIEIDDLSGTITKLSLLKVEIIQADVTPVAVPCSQFYNSIFINYSGKTTRRANVRIQKHSLDFAAYHPNETAAKKVASFLT